MFIHKNDETTDANSELNPSDATDAQVTDSVTESTDATTETDPTLAGEGQDAATDETSDSAEIDGESAGQTVAGVSDETASGDVEFDSGADTFGRAYVEKLRKESAGYRERAQRADDLAARLHTALVSATGRLADPTDLPFDAANLDDEQALSGAIDELLTRKPHLASRRPFGDVGQGNRGASSEPVNLADMLRARA
ncbi:hypothetical protein EB73_11815 [Mycobacterium sp. SWH-M3]|nr:hypothetical protein EB73_11815 [Mycobacterium sp. SWH-M3]